MVEADHLNQVSDELARLCAHHGIATGYFDAFGVRQEASAQSLIALLAEFGVQLDSAADAGRALDAAQRARRAEAMPPVLVVEASVAAWSAPLRLPLSMRRIRWKLNDEQGREQEGEIEVDALPETGRVESDVNGAALSERTLHMPWALEAGYHRLRIDGLVGETLVLATPGRCYRPPAVQGGGRVWGTSVQLYSLRSPRNWGIGDFSDLEALAVQMAAQGADIIGLNPLHALFASTPLHTSPYSPSSRQQLNVLCIDVEAVDGFEACKTAVDRVRSPDFQARLAALRATPLVDYSGVAAAKFEVLELLFENFRAQHLSPEGEPDETARGFLSFVAERGEALRQHALFETLQAHFLATEGGAWDWHAWPDAFRDPASAEVAAFAAANADRVRFHQYLQWLASRQLTRAAARCDALGMGVGLYVDLAVSVERAGSDVWGAQQVFAQGASVGAPPDEFNPAGQRWGLPPLRPDRLRADGYRFFTETLRASMRGAGALRIDHVMGLMRLFWIPPGRDAHEGAYVYYPLDEMLAIVAIESHRHRCMVVGEDLGTVEDAVRDALAKADVLSYRLFYFEKQKDGLFNQPDAYPAAALVAISTHDLATFTGWWTANDLRERLTLGLFPDPAIFDKQLMDRMQERIELVQAMQQAGVLSREEVAEAAGLALPSARIVEAAHAFLAAAPSALMMVQLEDVAGVVAQANMPGTVDQHPNWRRKLPEPVAVLAGGARMRSLGQALRAARPHRVATAQGRAAAGLETRVPRATYRLQFHKGFGFDDAIRVLPYLAKLGVSHVYCSPIQRARAGSMHGYDVVAHAEVNPELGGEEGFARFIAALKANGLGQLLDMVPNHMGVFGADNAWWMDVLENGPASLFAQHFDIDWLPLNVELTGKVLLPVLGVRYGEALESGVLVLHFERESGSFAIRYFEHRFPLAPESYPVVLEWALARLGDADGGEASDRLASLSSAFAHLPGRDTSSPDQLAERVRDKEVLKARLARLAQQHPSVAQAVLAAVAEINLAQPEARDALHRLVEVQAYRLAHWRVAADEINYRRFFDINDLAAVRMERDEVFEATQSFALDLAASGVVDGLRIDHPDGLYDPAEYFRKLQEGYARRAGLALPMHDADGRPARPLYVVAEKIAAGHEEVPASWHVHGTTGYRFANVANGVLVDTTAEASVLETWQRFTGVTEDFASICRAGRREVMRNALSSELNVLSTELLRIARADRSTRDYTLNALRRALAEVGACMPVYRTYIVDGPSAQDERFIDEAVDEAARLSGDADHSVFDFVRSALRAEAVASAPPALAERVRRFALRFQQFSAPVAAKGVEDTAFYRYFPLSALNEVGGEPDQFGFEVEEFHALSADRALRWPHTMLATSTHDNKRSEDVRNRIDVLSEMPNEWMLALTRWHGQCRGTREALEGGEAPSRIDEYLLYQTLLGTLPLGGLDAQTTPVYADRIWQYMQKAARESKLRTRWTQPDADYEAALERFVREILGDAGEGACLPGIQQLADRLAWFGAWNSLTLTLLKYASPGVPDLYQGSELIELSLVDPDNRRPVDYALRQQQLDALQAMAGQPGLAAQMRSMVEAPHDGRAKLWFIWRLLSLRREQPLLFRDGSYEPLAVEGPLARHVVAFARRHEGQMLVVVAGRLFVGLSPQGAEDGTVAALPDTARWSGTTLRLPQGVGPVKLENLLTGESLPADGGDVPLSDALRCMPWAAFHVRALP